MKTPMMTEEDEMSILAYAAPPLLTLLRRRQSNILQRLYNEYQSATLDLRPTVATYVAYTDLIRDIESRINQRENKET